MCLAFEVGLQQLRLVVLVLLEWLELGSTHRHLEQLANSPTLPSKSACGPLTKPLHRLLSKTNTKGTTTLHVTASYQPPPHTPALVAGIERLCSGSVATLL